MPLNPEVSALLAEREHPFSAVVDAVRAIVVDASPAIHERVKWNSPSYFADPDESGGKRTVDLGAFNLRAKGFVQLVLVFPNGLTDDPSRILEGDWADRRFVRFTDLGEVEAKTDALRRLVQDWVTRLPTGTTAS